jgi:hypothetical protein
MIPLTTVEYTYEDVLRFINHRGLCFFTVEGKIIIYTLPTCETIGVLRYDGNVNIPEILFMISKEVWKYIQDKEIKKDRTLDVDLLKEIFEDVIPENAQTVVPTEWENGRSGDNLIGRREDFLDTPHEGISNDCLESDEAK